MIHVTRQIKSSSICFTCALCLEVKYLIHIHVRIIFCFNNAEAFSCECGLNPIIETSVPVGGVLDSAFPNFSHVFCQGCFK